MTSPTRALLALALLVPLVALASRAQAQDTNQVVRIGLEYKPGTKPGIFVAPISGANGDSVRAILARDFDYGDRLTAMAPSGGEPLTGALNYPLYAQLGASAVVQASVTPGGGLH